MKGRDLIIYILQNGLEDEEIFKEGKFLDFISVEEAAVKCNTGVETIKASVRLGMMPGIKIGNNIFVASKY